mgnify:CR=1 FL=1
MDALFSGLKVIDAASFLAGPCAATILADYGANVVKVEPLGGDRQRSIAAGHPADWSWQLTDRNKRGLALDITAPEGSAVLTDMTAQAGVFLVNEPLIVLDRQTGPSFFCFYGSVLAGEGVHQTLPQNPSVFSKFGDDI